ncbi:hypothetical protein CIPAW_14G037200 [Carya illinoinensis]|uniref:Uncharacterized protein n=1 Tax=Carya illinoinensis TaxID=32201 RepID=A0A8T1NIX2_CARIL|nr:hypothetical protein CIPAW_14G037200 [Carya illinoinensis]
MSYGSSTILGDLHFPSSNLLLHCSSSNLLLHCSSSASSTNTYSIILSPWVWSKLQYGDEARIRVMVALQMGQWGWPRKSYPFHSQIMGRWLLSW